MGPSSFIIYTQEFVTLTLTCDTDIYDMICDHVEKIAARSPDQPSLERTKNRYGLTALMLAAYEGVTHVQAVADTPTQATTRCSGIFCADQATVCFTGAMAMSSVQETVVLPPPSLTWLSEYVYSLDQIDTQTPRTSYPHVLWSDTFDHRTNVCEILVNRGDTTGDIKYANLLREVPIR